MLDTFYHIETPENIDIEIRVAGPAVRALAYLLDLLVRGFALGAMFFLLSYFQKAGMGLFSIVAFLMEWFYPVLFEVLNKGQTPGKQTMGLRVLNDDGTPVNWSSSMLRNLLRFVDFMPAGYGVGLVACCLSGQFKRLGDMAAGTVVTYVAPKPAQPFSADIAPLPPILPLNVDEQRAILGFAERSIQLSEARRKELANHLGALVNSQDEEAVRMLQRIAVWLMGAR
jgi:uncharacterized RDD family membrane protein YckC